MILAPNLECAAVSASLLAAVARGDDDAIARSDAALSRFDSGPDQLYLALGQRARGLAMARADASPTGVRAAVAYLLDHARRHTRLGSWGYALDFWHEAFRLRPPTRALVAEAAAVVTAASGPLAQARIAASQAFVAGDVDALVASADGLEQLGARRDLRFVLERAAALAADQGFDRRARELRFRREALPPAGGVGAGVRPDAAGSVTDGRDRQPGADAGAWSLLTEREADIATRAAGGHPSKRIAADLGLSRRTVDNALQRVFAKLGVRSRGELIDHVPEPS